MEDKELLADEEGGKDVRPPPPPPPPRPPGPCLCVPVMEETGVYLGLGRAESHGASTPGLHTTSCSDRELCSVWPMCVRQLVLSRAHGVR